jgi:hypothetical protein
MVCNDCRVGYEIGSVTVYLCGKHRHLEPLMKITVCARCHRLDHAMHQCVISGTAGNDLQSIKA